MEYHKPKPVGEERVSYNGKILQVLEQDMQIGEKHVKFERARRAPGIRLIILSKDKDKILIPREYRTEQGGYDFRLPGGKVFDSLTGYIDFLGTDEDILIPAAQKAKEEALEEVGIVVEDLRHFKTVNCGATVEWDLIYFVVEGHSEHSDGQQLEVGELIDVEWATLAEAEELVLSGQMGEYRSAMVLLQYIHTLRK